MPEQKGPIRLSGTIGNATYYKMDGKHLVRTKSSLTKERVSTDPAFKRSRAASTRFAKASKLASKIYQQLPITERKHGVIGTLTGKVTTLLKQGHTAKAVEILLAKNRQQLLSPGSQAKVPGRCSPS